MSKYEDLSRRGLIKLGHDYDRDNDDALAKYLGEAEAAGSAYEEIRPAEAILDKADTMAQKLSDAGTSAAYSLLDRMTEKLTTFVDQLADDIADGDDLTEGEPDPEEA
ncbi:hypothetical protein [uncultured Duncaniella sp.]|uniref:hypothetical protein n=1 Tax=uncultured Duncaniella sp. TaxID=2768039 RepID=UPI0026300AF7|nr:hypothetical protein [uncultured Duncaniella sp.]